MMRFLLFLKHKCGFVWSSVEFFNSFLFNLLYGKKMKLAIHDVLDNQRSDSYRFALLGKNDAENLCEFFSKQPEEMFKYFKPHDFDIKTINRKITDKAFITIGCFDSDKIIGYCFIRCFFNGKAFRGKIVDANYQGRGIAKKMGAIISAISYSCGLRLYATISKDNLASMNSSKAINEVVVVEELPDNYVYIEYLPLVCLQED